MYKTAESVSPSHPDKLCDRISDAILDACLEQDPMSRVAIETFGCHGVIHVGGELTTQAFVNFRDIVTKIVPNYGVEVNIVQQSPEISQGVDIGGAGDQGIMVGYACDDNEDMIPQELYLARWLCMYLYERFPNDGKTQITIDNNGDIKEIVASFQNVKQNVLFDAIVGWMNEIDPEDLMDYNIHANPAGDWSIGGFDADTGLTGRKLMVDNYGPQIPIGGGCFSGKDATKVDRSAAYMARKIAVDCLKRFNLKICKVKIAYAIGVEQPVMANAVLIDKENNAEEIDLLDNNKNIHYNLTPKGIIEYLDLRKPIYSETAKWGHFGRNNLWDK